MARISGVDLPREKRVEIGLTYIFGIGVKTSQEILAATGVNPDTRVKDLTEQDVDISLDIKRMMEIGCYRGVRHRKGLPVRGQNTKQNARTRKGPKKTIAGKKKATR